ncbi:hypothetical protein SAMN04515647_0814 [Cohaesibacter sp. ES.047]|uniref:hypothetical protein n=1 Tax=Cohaesibacter sp. ES.047 TaxID=1798205 RepID=UPI000BB8D67B|nr:hypothetical protein [Cohaesibacter sp. ES.047]SNY90643.1 hypothetical protein SAMN04515647_0814 [Cohaesibacter sp. ES.047]
MADDHNQTPQTRQDARQKEAEQVLRRVEMEGEAIGMSSFARTANKAKDHFAAGDTDADDPIEKWGTRIGRGAGAIFAIILVIWLVDHFTR